MNEQWFRDMARDIGKAMQWSITQRITFAPITDNGLLNAKDRAGAECERCEEVVRRELERIGGGK